jgi:hypothetical protein
MFIEKMLYKKFNYNDLVLYFNEIKDICANEKVFINMLNGYRFELKKAGYSKKNEQLFGVQNSYYKFIEIYSIPHSNLSQLIDTIAHEIAHIKFSNHGRKHTKFKMQIKTAFKAIMDYNRCKNLSIAS